MFLLFLIAVLFTATKKPAPESGLNPLERGETTKYVAPEAGLQAGCATKNPSRSLLTTACK
jgi:hypothetical protein